MSRSGDDRLPHPPRNQLQVYDRWRHGEAGVANPFSDIEERFAAVGPDWPAAIEMIRDVGARVRRARRSAQDVAQQSQAAVAGALRRLEETERRLRAAEVAREEAQLRAERAEAAAASADARARRAEEETVATRAKFNEAQEWLGRLYDSVQVEFRDLNQPE